MDPWLCLYICLSSMVKGGQNYHYQHIPWFALLGTGKDEEFNLVNLSGWTSRNGYFYASS
jgi:hypothetical protein